MTDREELLGRTADLANDFLDRLPNRPVARPVDLEKLRQALGGPLPDGPEDPVSVVEGLARGVEPGLVGSAGPRYFGFVIGGGVPAALAADWLTSTWDQNAAMYATSPAAAVVEEVAASWLIQLFGLPEGSSVGFVTGATMANFTGLAAARHAVLGAHGWDVEAQGLFGAPPITVVVGNEVHVSVLKGLAMLGLGRERVVRVPADDQGRMIAARLPTLDGPTIVCLQAGNVNTGAFDPIGEVAARLRDSGAWIHVDGAFGLWAAASAQRTLTNGIDLADSIATDAHKWLNVPYDSGLVFVRDARTLNAAMSASAAYLPEGQTRDPQLFVPEMSRRARAVEVWAALRSLGRRGLAEMIERNCRHAARFASELRKAGHQVLNDVVLNQVLVSFGAPEVTRRVIAAIQQDGTCWCGGTSWQGNIAMRISVSSWATSEADVEQSIAAIVRCAREAERA
jgi:glutamate/tyrosine decarboxylase-like PLP-dependent enzyme